jgi:hypothetical protein
VYKRQFICLAIAGVLTIVLKKYWWDNLKEMDEYEKDAINIR